MIPSVNGHRICRTLIIRMTPTRTPWESTLGGVRSSFVSCMKTMHGNVVRMDNQLVALSLPSPVI